MKGVRRLPVGRAALAALGYRDALIVDEFDVWAGGRTVVRADSVAFAAPPADMRTAAVVCESARDQRGRDDGPFAVAAVAAARALDAPLMLKTGDDAARLFERAGEGPPRPLTEWVARSDFAGLERLAAQAGPAAVLRLKREDRQLALVSADVGSLRPSAAGLRAELAVRVEQSLLALEEGVAPFVDPELPGAAIRSASRLLVGALTCLMIRDKQQAGVTAEALPDVALQRYPRYFQWYAAAPEAERRLLRASIDELGEGMTFRGLSPSIVSDVYETVLVDETMRRDLGVHYTPSALAARLVDALPVEEVPPAQRVVLDMACGSGTLLLAAYERLGRLLPPDLEPAARHGELTSRLHGWDKDPLAVQISQLALLLHDLPGGNGWLIEERDALDPAPVSWTPSIVVANPPWRLQRAGEDGRRVEQADAFVGAALDRLAPDGLLGLVLPAGWLTGMYSRKVRERLQHEADLFEVWRLPETVFGSARVPVAVLCARKRPPDDKSTTLVRRVGASGGWPRFAAGGPADELLLAHPQGPLGVGALTAALAGTSTRPLSDYASVTVGPQPKVSLRQGRPTPPATDRWLARAGHLPAFGPPPFDAVAPAAFPADFHRNSPRELVLAPKVLASATRWSENPWRIKASIDPDGVIARNSLFCVAPRPSLPLPPDRALHALLALLGSAVASAWIDETATKRSASVHALAGMPVPHDVDWDALADLGISLHAHYDDPRLLTADVRRLDELVFRAYRLPPAAVEAVKRRMAQAPSPEGADRFPGAARRLADDPGGRSAGTNGWTPGTVLAVDGDRLLLWAAGVTEQEGTWVVLPARIPGALCRQGQTFEVDAVDADGLADATYRFQPAAWWGDDELALSAAQ